MTKIEPPCPECEGRGVQRFGRYLIDCGDCRGTGDKHWTEAELNEWDKEFNTQVVAEIEALTGEYVSSFDYDDILEYVRQAHADHLTAAQLKWFEEGLGYQFDEADYYRFLHSLPR